MNFGGSYADLTGEITRMLRSGSTFVELSDTGLHKGCFWVCQQGRRDLSERQDTLVSFLRKIVRHCLRLATVSCFLFN